MVEKKIRFGFGKNWDKFIKKHFEEERIEQSKNHLLDFLNLHTLSGKYFLDIGCGSGLSSLAAYRSDAKRIVSFDYDPVSVETTRKLKQYVNNPNSWDVVQGSILDDEFVASLEPADVVYAWGVLHHTGDVWHAIDNTFKLLKPDGLMYLALYEYNVQKNPSPEFWLDVKVKYNQGGWWKKRKYEIWYIWTFMFYKKIRNLPNVIRDIQSRKGRGMAFYTDLVDWLGGWPMEFVKLEDFKEWASQNNLAILNLSYGEANTEYLCKLEVSR